jgi:hypothetical protein
MSTTDGHSLRQQYRRMGSVCPNVLAEKSGVKPTNAKEAVGAGAPKRITPALRSTRTMRNHIWI